MDTFKFLNEFVSPVCHKRVHSWEEMNAIPDPLLVKATTFYQLYQHNVFEGDDRLSLRQFFRVCSQYFYYDKMVCEHGTEFYYYVVFNEDNEMYKLTKDIVRSRVKANAPDTLTDLSYIIEAVTRRENV